MTSRRTPSARGWAAALAAALICASAAAGDIPAGERRSGTAFMGRQSQEMQQDDMLNPGMLWVAEGGQLWDAAPPGAQSCGGCHGDAAQSMRGVAARYPAFSDSAGKPLNLQQQVNLCRTGRQKQPPLQPESRPLLALVAFVAHQSRGLPLAPPGDARLAPHRARGEALFTTPMGQLDFSCAQCHDDNWDRRLAGSPVTQAHPTGYPIYRLEWQSLGSLQRRLRNCMVGVRAEPFAYDSEEMVQLELYLAARATGMTLETPGVRP